MKRGGDAINSQIYNKLRHYYWNAVRSWSTAYTYAKAWVQSVEIGRKCKFYGMPCIATNVGGVPSLIQDGETGYLVPANDPYQMAYLIHQLYLDPTLNIKMGLAAQREARARHDRKEIGKRIVEIYKEILEQR